MQEKLAEVIQNSIRVNFIMDPDGHKPLTTFRDFEGSQTIGYVMAIGLMRMHGVDDELIKTELDIEGQEEIEYKYGQFKDLLEQAAKMKMDTGPQPEWFEDHEYDKVRRFRNKYLLCQKHIELNQPKEWVKIQPI